MPLKITCLCPVIVGHSTQLLANSLACFVSQTYPASLRRMLVLDDLRQFPEQMRLTEENIFLRTCQRSPSLPHKYHQLIEIDDGWADAFAVWDHDDIYLPDHLEAAAEALELRANLFGDYDAWCHPEYFISSHPGGRMLVEPAAGRMHGSLVVRREALATVGGWVGVVPADRPRVANFDQRLLAALAHSCTLVRPLADGPTYVYRWATIAHDHCSGLMRSPEDETWYSYHVQRILERGPLPKFERVVPEPDAETAAILQAWFRGWRVQASNLTSPGRDPCGFINAPGG